MDGFDRLWESLADIGRDRSSGGYHRLAWTAVDRALREWFAARAAERQLVLDPDRNGNLWAWWGEPPATGSAAAVATGSHLDSVPDGGGYDGALGVVSAFAAVDRLRSMGFQPRRPIAVVAFAEEEGARFGVPCLGSGLLTGALDPERVRGLRDGSGDTLAAALAGIGIDPAALGRDDDRLGRLGAFVELHVEQGRLLADLGAPVGVGSAIWPHGRWRYEFAGAPDHAGTAPLAGRRDPMLTFANTVLAARKRARLSGAVATVGRVEVRPNATNAVPAAVHCWLDARAAEESTLEALVTGITLAAMQRARRDGVSVRVTQEARTGAVTFDAELAGRLAGILGRLPELPAAVDGAAGAAPLLATGAGHDAGVLAAHLPVAMLFVRNPTGVSHSPAEWAELADCRLGVAALAAVLAELGGS